jgi:hypothetical protein
MTAVATVAAAHAAAIQMNVPSPVFPLGSVFCPGADVASGAVVAAGRVVTSAAVVASAAAENLSSSGAKEATHPSWAVI